MSTLVHIILWAKSLILSARRGTRTRNPSFTNPAIARLGEHDSHFVCIFVCINPYNLSVIEAPVSRVSCMTYDAKFITIKK